MIVPVCLKLSLQNNKEYNSYLITNKLSGLFPSSVLNQSIFNLRGVGWDFISSPEPKAHGELIVYQSSRRPSVRASVCASVRSHF